MTESGDKCEICRLRVKSLYIDWTSGVKGHKQCLKSLEARFERWFAKKDLPLDVDLFKTEDGGHIGKKRVQKILKAGARQAFYETAAGKLEGPQ